MNGVAAARIYAARAHGKQLYGRFPYMQHLDAVARVLEGHFYDVPQDLMIAAYLHDVIEDTTLIYHDIFAAFGPEVAELVWAATGEGKNRKEQQASIRHKIAGNHFATILKLADRIANVEFSGEMKSEHREKYLAEAEAFEAACRVCGPSAVIDGMIEQLNRGYEKCRLLGSAEETPATSGSETDQSEVVRRATESSEARQAAVRADQAHR